MKLGGGGIAIPPPLGPPLFSKNIPILSIIIHKKSRNLEWFFDIFEFRPVQIRDIL